MRSTHNLKKKSSWFWRLLTKSAHLSKPWGRFFHILCVSQKFQTLPRGYCIFRKKKLSMYLLTYWKYFSNSKWVLVNLNKATHLHTENFRPVFKAIILRSKILRHHFYLPKVISRIEHSRMSKYISNEVLLTKLLCNF